MKTTAGKPSDRHRIARGHNSLGLAVGISLVLHALLLILPHPAIWFPIAGVRHDTRQSALTVRFAVRGFQSDMAEDVPFAPPQAAPGIEQMPSEPSPYGATSQVARPPKSFHLARDLSRQPELLSDLTDATWLHDVIAGEILFRLVVSSKGVATHIQVLRSTLPRAIEGAAAWRLYTASYRPGEMNGMPVDAEMFVEMKVGATAD